MINNISIPVLENEISEYSIFKFKYNKYKKKCRNKFLRCFYINKLRKYEKKYKSKLFYLKMKYTYSDTYLKYFRGIEDTDILENILINKQLIENPTEPPDLEKTKLLPKDTYFLESNNIIQVNPEYNPPSVNPDFVSQETIPNAYPVTMPTPSAPYFEKDEYSEITI